MGKFLLGSESRNGTARCAMAGVIDCRLLPMNHCQAQPLSPPLPQSLALYAWLAAATTNVKYHC